jgi:hypothetical protein
MNTSQHAAAGKAAFRKIMVAGRGLLLAAFF